MTQHHDGGYDIRRLHDDTQPEAAGTGEAVAYFSNAAAAERAMLALREAGYTSELREGVWETLSPQRRDVLLYTTVGLGLGFLVGTVLALLWWAITGAFPAGAAISLPITLALAGTLLYLGCTALGGWLGYRYAVRLHRRDPALETAPNPWRFAVTVPLSDPRGQRTAVERILHGQGGILPQDEAA